MFSDNNFNNLETFAFKILGIESSCDESAISILNISFNTANLGKMDLAKLDLKFNDIIHLLKNRQIKVEKELVATHSLKDYSGIVPESAARQHFFFLPNMLQKILPNIEEDIKKINAICYTAGPGLSGGLMLGATLAKAISISYDKPIYATNHIIGHALSSMIENPTLLFPYCCLLVSGGHTLLLEVHSWDNIKVLASTKDDAMGELFDKVATYLGFGFPGGKTISQYATKGKVIKHFKLPKFNQNSKNNSKIDKISDTDLEDYFSFSGLKTGFIRLIDEIKAETGELSETNKQDICATLQDIICRVCADKLITHMEKSNIKQYTIVGGVASNMQIRNTCQEIAEKYNKEIFYPSLSLCTDNASMIAFAGFFKYLEKRTNQTQELTKDIYSTLKINKNNIIIDN